MNEALLKNLLRAIDQVIDDWDDNDDEDRLDPEGVAMIENASLRAMADATLALHAAMDPGALFGKTDAACPTPLADEITLLVYPFNDIESQRRIRALAASVGELECRATRGLS